MSLWKKIVDWFEFRQIKLDRKRRQDALNQRLEIALCSGRIEDIEQALIEGAQPSILLQHYTTLHYGKPTRQMKQSFHRWRCLSQHVELPKKRYIHNDGCSIERD